MTPFEWLVAAANTFVMVLLIRASTAKLAAPSPAGAAIAEIFPRARSSFIGAVRCVAVLELVTVLTMPIPVLRMPAQSLVVLLGVGFLGLGAAGMARASRRPCGCFGSGGTRPFGLVNVFFGVTFLVAAVLNAVVGDPVEAGTMSACSALLATIGTAGWLIFLNRRHAGVVISNFRYRPEVSA